MIAFKVQNDEGGVIVFHETAGKAKSFALQKSEWFDWNEFTDLSASREPGADRYATQEASILDFCTNASIYHKLGWYCHSRDYCKNTKCLLNQDEEI